jgi:hypothetical protein
MLVFVQVSEDIKVLTVQSKEQVIEYTLPQVVFFASGFAHLI